MSRYYTRERIEEINYGDPDAIPHLPPRPRFEDWPYDLRRDVGQAHVLYVYKAVAQQALIDLGYVLVERGQMSTRPMYNARGPMQCKFAAGYGIRPDFDLMALAAMLNALEDAGFAYGEDFAVHGTFKGQPSKFPRKEWEVRRLLRDARGPVAQA